jgi:hypothetical protein
LETIDEGLVLAKAPAWALDVDDDRQVQQAVQDGGGHHGVAEQLGPAGRPRLVAHTRAQLTTMPDLDARRPGTPALHK